mmetsp:Transcript_74378/g.206470  ORF Transcript_74378/g.206470 Transcript_74378/m.206470 type:complete len:522 (-) Transcript_74378:70-1635(-)
MPHVHFFEALARRRSRAIALGFVRPSQPRWSHNVSRRLQVVGESLSYHEKHCNLVGRSVNKASVASALAKPFIAAEEYRSARSAHRTAGLAKHANGVGGTDDILWHSDPWASSLPSSGVVVTLGSSLASPPSGAFLGRSSSSPSRGGSFEGLDQLRSSIFFLEQRFEVLAKLFHDIAELRSAAIASDKTVDHAAGQSTSSSPRAFWPRAHKVVQTEHPPPSSPCVVLGVVVSPPPTASCEKGTSACHVLLDWGVQASPEVRHVDSLASETVAPPLCVAHVEPMDDASSPGVERHFADRDEQTQVERAVVDMQSQTPEFAAFFVCATRFYPRHRSSCEKGFQAVRWCDFSDSASASACDDELHRKVLDDSDVWRCMKDMAALPSPICGAVLSTDDGPSATIGNDEFDGLSIVQARLIFEQKCGRIGPGELVIRRDMDGRGIEEVCRVGFGDCLGLLRLLHAGESRVCWQHGAWRSRQLYIKVDVGTPLQVTREIALASGRVMRTGARGTVSEIRVDCLIVKF